MVKEGDNELGNFLLKCREALTPDDVGLPAGSRRRVRGLRREEVAAISGISVENIKKVEQGRIKRPSPETLTKLADALQLTLSQRVYVYERAKAIDPYFNSMGAPVPNRCVRDPVKEILKGFGRTTAAALINRMLEILDYTDYFELIFGPLGVLDSRSDEEPPNLIRYLFADERARKYFPEWSKLADNAVAGLKRGPRNALADELISELTLISGLEFTERMDNVPGLTQESLILRVIHPKVGNLRFRFEVLTLPADDDQQIVIHMADDPTTVQALEQLISSPPETLLSEPVIAAPQAPVRLTGCGPHGATHRAAHIGRRVGGVFPGVTSRFRNGRRGPSERAHCVPGLLRTRRHALYFAVPPHASYLRRTAYGGTGRTLTSRRVLNS